MKSLVVLGAGTAGTMVVNKLRHRLPTSDWRSPSSTRTDIHDYQPGYLFMPFGMNDSRAGPQEQACASSPTASSSCSPTSTGSTPQAARSVSLTDGRTLPYDQLVIASGTTPRPDQTPGMLGAEWHRSVGEFYTYDGALALARLARRLHGRPPRRAHHRDADQVPRRAPRVHLPRRRLPHRARSARPHRDRLRHPARRRLHQAGREPGARATCSRSKGDHRRDRLHGRAASTRSGRSSCPTTSARSPTTSS